MVQKLSETCWLPRITRRLSCALLTLPAPGCFPIFEPAWLKAALGQEGKKSPETEVSLPWALGKPSCPRRADILEALSPTSPCPRWCCSAFLQNKSCPRLQMAVVISLTDINKIDGCEQTNDLL